ncbi:MAG: hypothetical protein C4575_12570 [Desulforudis sp.]|nr:MAG: hypothetical protein C4575_12570 [Desulforudis sp.]
MRYSVVLTPDPEDGGYIVTVPSLPGCVSEGDTIEEALANIRDAIAVFLASLSANDEPTPLDGGTIIATVEVAVSMPPVPWLPAKDIVRAFGRAGYRADRQSGSHIILRDIRTAGH